ncbi:hypothetical protein SAICODRAFT_77966 [Saitoella complicata NRRL Y-17804]|nr:uncharacterized protein SAICODRAFT_77966 [Saitoella complicata NRRL Y-17804]ODQ54484.1 hypothetical protein SAICODRAFT_77966 [Saitoella complicata NRRL Y-17804]
MSGVDSVTATSPTPSYDFRSDTVTTPTASILASLSGYPVGDDVYHEDSTTGELEKFVADLTGKESALFVPTGTMGNQLCIRTWLTQPPHSVLCDHRAHVYAWEAGAMAMLSQAMVSPVTPSNGVYLRAEDVEASLVLGDDIHTAPTKVISLENTLGGTIMPLSAIQRIAGLSKAEGIKLHLDGARLWEASAATGIAMASYGSYFDSMSLCLSKGIGAPMGSVIVGPADFIKKARWFRKAMGGGMRQTGIMAGAARTAIEEVFFGGKLREVHARTKQLAGELMDLGYTFQLPVQTNMIWIDLAAAGVQPSAFALAAEKAGLRVGGGRIVLHHQIVPSAIERLKTVLKELKEQSPAEPLERDYVASKGASVPYGSYGKT